MRVCKYVCYVCICVYMYVCVCMYLHIMYLCVMYVYVCMYICIYILCICVCVCMYVCKCNFSHSLYHARLHAFGVRSKTGGTEAECWLHPSHLSIYLSIGCSHPIYLQAREKKCSFFIPHWWCADALRAAGKVTAEEAVAAVQMLQNMGDDKIKEEANALTARSEAPPIALVTP